MKKKLKKILSYSPFVLLLITMILIIQLGYSLAQGDVPTIFNRAISYVPTPSMEDEIMAGDLIIVDTNYDELQTGDVVSFFTEVNGRKVSITHRIVEINGDVFTTKGDNNNQIYSWERDVPIEDVIGVYEGQRSPFLGSLYGRLFSSRVNLMFLLIIGIFIVIMGLEVFNIYKTLLEKKQKEDKEKMIEEAKQKLKEDEDNT